MEFTITIHSIWRQSCLRTTGAWARIPRCHDRHRTSDSHWPMGGHIFWRNSRSDSLDISGTWDISSRGW